MNHQHFPEVRSPKIVVILNFLESSEHVFCIKKRLYIVKMYNIEMKLYVSPCVRLKLKS